MTSLSHFLSSLIAQFLALALAFSVITLLEFVAPKNQQPPISRMNGLVFWSIFVIFGSLIPPTIRAAWHQLDIRPLVTVPLTLSQVPALAPYLCPFLAAFVGDFAFYWFHRAQHQWLWKYHAVHHSIENLNAVNSYHHVTEEVFRLMITILPLSLVDFEFGPAALIVSFPIYLQIFYIHSSTRLHLGPLGLVLVDNRFHRLHHSLEQAHFDRNFGAFTTFWDWLFGTLTIPKAKDWPATGLAETPEPKSVRDWLMIPRRLAAR